MSNKDFEDMWKDNGVEAVGLTQEELNECTPEWQILDALARYKLLSQMLQYYMYAKHGCKMVTDIPGDDDNPNDVKIKFQLNK